MNMPALYIGHGAPILLEDRWATQLADWAKDLPLPKAILIVSAHWESAPLMIGSTGGAPLIYDFGGFHPKYYNLQYSTPDATWLAEELVKLMPQKAGLYQAPSRGLDHGAYIPLMAMYPNADIPVIQMSIPTRDPLELIELGRRISPLKQQGVLIIGSGFLTHGLPYISMQDPDVDAPGWSADFDSWAAEGLLNGDVNSLLDYKRAPGMQYAHPTPDHLLPMYVTLGAAENIEAGVDTKIDGFWYGLSKRSFQVT